MTASKTKQTKQPAKPAVEPIFRPRIDFRIVLKDGSVHDVFTTPVDSLTFGVEYRATFNEDPTGDLTNQETFFIAYVAAKRNGFVASWDEFLENVIDLALVASPPLP